VRAWSGTKIPHRLMQQLRFEGTNLRSVGQGTIAIRRGVEPGRRWEVATPVLSPMLHRFVPRCCGYREESERSVVRVEMPLASVVVDLSLGGDPLAVDGEAMPSGFAAGLSETTSEQRVGPSQEGIQLFLSPAAAAAICGVSSAELARDVVRFEALGPAQRELVSRLREHASWPSRFALLDRWLCDRIARRAPSSLVESAVSALRDGEHPRVDRVAADAGCSPRHLSRLFSAAVGTSPRTYARLSRFARVVAHLRGVDATRAAVPWARFAAELGFADQPHLAREVRHFSGMTPAVLARRLEVFAS
jgi:AraC-like DNA-binding protein